jgi:chloride channel protein, CIC family
MNRTTFESNIFTIKLLLFWFASALLAGALGTLIVYTFTSLSNIISHFLIESLRFSIFIYPMTGAFLVGIIIYRIEPLSMGEGLPSYLVSLKENNGDISFRETFFKFWAALLTLSSFGNGGIIGPVGRVSAGVMSSIGKLFTKNIMKLSYLHLYSICGLSAAIGALLDSPIGAGIFAVEIIQRKDMKYGDLFPAILSSSASVFFSRIIGLEPIFSFSTVYSNFDPGITGWLLLIALIAGLAGYGYIKLYETISSLMHRDHSHRNIVITSKAVLGSLLASLIAFSVNYDILGTSTGLHQAVFNNNIDILYGQLPHFLPLSLVLLIVIILKATANCVTVGSGLSAGFAGPAMLTGILLGAAVASIAGINPGTPEYMAFLATGFAAMLSSTMNIPVASAVITLELFGLAFSFPAGVASIIGFQINRSNNLYDFAMRERKSEYE